MPRQSRRPAWLSVCSTFSRSVSARPVRAVGPMRAAALFTAALRQRQALSAVRRLEVRLYGSLSATGVGHGTDRAVIMGLMGEWPDRIDPTQIAPRMAALLDSGLLQLDGRVAVPFDWVRDMRLLDENLPYHPNAMTLVPTAARRHHLLLGGRGFVVDAAQAASGQLDQDHTVLPRLLQRRGTVAAVQAPQPAGIRADAGQRTHLAQRDRYPRGLRRIWQAMRDCVDNGLRNEGILPGGLNVQRRAAPAPQPAGDRQAQRDRLDPQRHGMGQPVRPGGERGERRRRTHGHRAHQRRGGDHPGGAALLYEVQSDAQDRDVVDYLLAAAAWASCARRTPRSPAPGRLPGRVGSACAMAAAGLAVPAPPRRRSRTLPRSVWNTTSG